MNVRLTLPIPPGKNRTNRAGMTKSGGLSRPGLRLKADYFEDVKLATIAAGVYGKGLQGELALTVRYYWPNRRGMTDLDAGRSWLQDCLAKNIGFNDARIAEAHEYRDIRRGNVPHVEVEIVELEYE